MPEPENDPSNQLTPAQRRAQKFFAQQYAILEEEEDASEK